MGQCEDIVPLVNEVPGGRGVSRQRTDAGVVDAGVLDGYRLMPRFVPLASRLADVVVLNRDWTGSISPTMLGDTPSHPNKGVAIFMDPPYLTGDRHKALYQSDGEGTSDQVAEAAFAWALRHGDRYRIAYACHAGDFSPPGGWEAVTRSFRGIRSAERRDRGDLILFSPACGQPQLKLFA